MPMPKRTSHPKSPLIVTIFIKAYHMSNRTPRALAAVLEIMYCCAAFEEGQLGVSVKISLTKQEWTQHLKKAHRNSSGQICNFSDLKQTCEGAVTYSVWPWKTFTEWIEGSLKSHRRKVVSRDDVTTRRWVGCVQQCVSSWSCPTTMRTSKVKKIRLFISTYTQNEMLMIFSFSQTERSNGHFEL